MKTTEMISHKYKLYRTDKTKYLDRLLKYGCAVHKIDRYFPSSRLCTCGYKNDKLTLTDREWTCPVCGQTRQRDLFAAQNILRQGIAELGSGSKSPRQSPRRSRVSHTRISSIQGVRVCQTTKTQEAINAFKKQDLKGALRIFKGFDHQFAKNELRTIQIAYEVLTGKGSFYKQLGINIGHMVVESISIIENKYNITY